MAATLMLLVNYLRNDLDPERDSQFVKLGPQGTVWIHVNKFLSRLEHGTSMIGDIPKLRHTPHWGLLEKADRLVNDYDPSHPQSGYYRVTERGFAFVDCQLRVYAYYVDCGDGVVEWDTLAPLVSIDQALGTKFSYEGLMRGVVNISRN
jgi:hypothetical protein